MSKTVKKVTKPFKKIGNAVKKTVSSAFKAIGNAARKAGQAIGLIPVFPAMPEMKDPAPPAPEPEQYAEGMSRPEGIGRRKRNRRNGLRIDLNTGGAPAGNGVNLPVG